MPDFPLQFRASDYLTEHGQTVRAKRGYLLCEFAAIPILCDAFLDTAAPFSVVPHTFARQVPWLRLAGSLTKAGKSAASALLWQGIPCELGTIPLRCVHLGTGIRSGLLQITAKFPSRPTAHALERALVVGLNFLEENDCRRTAGILSGFLSLP